MIGTYTRLRVADNTGAKEIMCVRVLGTGNQKYARVGDKIVAAVKEASPGGSVVKGSIVHAVVVRTRKETRRKDGSLVRFDQNAAVIIDETGNPKGTRIFGPVCRELRDRGYMKIISLAPEVV